MREAFYAVEDPATPARTAGQMVLLNAAASVTLLYTANLGTAALTLTSTFASAGNAFLLARRFRRHAPHAEGIGQAWLRSIAATAAMARSSLRPGRRRGRVADVARGR